MEMGWGYLEMKFYEDCCGSVAYLQFMTACWVWVVELVHVCVRDAMAIAMRSDVGNAFHFCASWLCKRGMG